MSLSEFDLIARYFSHQAVNRKDVILGIGDDGAVLQAPQGCELVISTDTLVSEVHFPSSLSPQSVGYRALAVNLSDLAAMGAEPAWMTLALTLPENDETWLAGFSAGFMALANEWSLQLIGGDLTRGPLTITVQITGFVPTGQALKRSTARPGDAIYVTGTLGDAALALQRSRSGDIDSDPFLKQRFERPEPRVEVGLKLRGIATSAIDVSDGLAADLGHVLAASGCGGTILSEAMPFSPRMLSLTDRTHATELALGGGDDYELCFTARPDADLAGLPCAVCRIGTVEAEAGLYLEDREGRRTLVPPRGYAHF